MNRIIYRGRFIIWALLFFLVYFYRYVCPALDNWLDEAFKDPEISYITLDTDYVEFDGFSKVSGYIVNDHRLTYVDDEDNCDILVTEKEITDDSYIKYENALYTPYVLYFKARAYESSNNLFINLSGSNYTLSSCLECDLYKILDGMLNDKEWKDIGVSKNVAKGPITLHIPNESSMYWDDVLDIFYITLNAGKDVTEEDKARLQGDIDKILSKCVKERYILNAIQMADAKEPIVALAPEMFNYHGSDLYKCFGNDNGDQYKPVYMKITKNIYFNMYIKKQGIEGEEDFGDSLMNYIKSNSYFNARTGFRVKGRTYTVNNINEEYIELIKSLN